MPTPKEIQELSYQKAIRLEKLIDEVEKRINKTSSYLTNSILKQFLNKLKVENGRIQDTLDRTTTTLFNQAYGDYANNSKNDLVVSIVSDIHNIVKDNGKFYTTTSNATPIQVDDVKWIVNRRLGIDEDGSLIKKGYLSGLLDDESIKSDLQKYIFKELFKGVGPEALKEGIKEYIEGDDNKLGAFRRHYRTFSFDVYAQLNGFSSALYAERLGLTHFIYNGGLIETSRAFCIKRNAGVYSTAEAEEWVNDPTLTAILSKDTYNWVIDRGGFNCRHTTDFIAKEIAYALRPDLKEKEEAASNKKADTISESLAKEAAKNVNIDLTGGLVEVMQRIREEARKIMTNSEIETFRKKYDFIEYLKSKGSLYKSKLDFDKFQTPQGRKELDTIKKLLDRGLDFYVMPNKAIGKSTDGKIKNLDGLLFNKNAYKAVEIKTLTTGSPRTVTNRIKDAGSQSNRVIIDITGSISQRDLAIGLRNGMQSNKNISAVQIIRNNKLITISRYESKLSQAKFIKLIAKKMRQ